MRPSGEGGRSCGGARGESLPQGCSQTLRSLPRPHGHQNGVNGSPTGLQTSSQADRRSWRLDPPGGRLMRWRGLQDARHALPKGRRPRAPGSGPVPPGSTHQWWPARTPEPQVAGGPFCRPGVSRCGRLCTRWCREGRTPVRVFTRRHVQPGAPGTRLCPRARGRGPTRSHGGPYARVPTHTGPVHMSPWASGLYAPCTLTSPRASQPTPEPWAPQESGGPSLPNRTNRLCPRITNLLRGERGGGRAGGGVVNSGTGAGTAS